MPKTGKSMDGWAEVVGEETIRALRSAACPPGRKTLWLHKHLNDNQIAEVYYRIFRKNEDPKSVVRMVKEDWEVNPHWQPRDFLVGLRKWITSLSTSFSEVIQTRDNQKQVEYYKKKQEAEKKLSENLDVLEKMAFAINVTATRLNMAHDREKVANIPMRITDEITRTLEGLCRTYVSLAIKTGTIDGTTPEVNVNFKLQADMVLEKYIGNDGAKMVKASQIFLQKAAEKVIELEQDPETGEYVEVEKKSWRDT